jgi:GR25 family glycosyltransferase involved in LPS biosynthesis
MWEFLNIYNIDVWCICLKERADRFTIIANEFEKVGLTKYVQYHRPNRNKNGGLGCLLSHQFCAESSLKKNKHALVFEDDIKFSDDWEEKILYIKTFLQNEPNWNVLRLGTIISSINKQSVSSDKLWLCKSYSTYSLIYNKNIINKIFSDSYFNTSPQIDDYLHDTHTILDYSLINSICIQRRGLGSDNNWFGNTLIQSFMESYYVIEPLQKYNNIQAWYIKFLPIYIQDKITIWSLLCNIGFLSKKIHKLCRCVYL